MLGFMKSLTNSRADALDGLDLLREQIADAGDEIARIAAAPQPVADALKAFDAWAGQVATEGVDSLRLGRLLRPETAQGYELPRSVVRAGDSAVYDYGAATEALLGLLVATAMPALRKIVQGQLDDLTAGRETLTPAARAKKLDQAKADLFNLELREESAIRAMEAAGMDIARRADADPRALLASDKSLATAA